MLFRDLRMIFRIYQFNIKQSKDRTTDTDVVTEESLYKAARSFIEFMDRMAAERI